MQICKNCHQSWEKIKDNQHECHGDLGELNEKHSWEEIEIITRACVVIPTGKQYVDNSHSNCYGQMGYDEDEKNYLSEECKEGFLTSTGRFVDRYDAAKIALAAGQIEKKVGALNSYMVDYNKY